MKLGQRVKQIRERKGIKAKFIAVNLGYNPNSLSPYYKFEKGEGNFDCDKIPLLAELLGVNIEELFFDENLHETSK